MADTDDLTHIIPAVLSAENESLKTELRVAKERILLLEQQVARSTLDKTEISLLDKIAQCDIETGFEVNFFEDLHLSKPRLDYHLQRLVNAGCVEVLFVDPELGENFAITQDGREVLVKKHLL